MKFKKLIIPFVLLLSVIGCKTLDGTEQEERNQQVAQLTADLIELVSIITPLVIEDRVPTTAECQSLTEATKNLTLTITDLATDKEDEIEMTARVANIIAPVVSTGCLYIPEEE